MNNLLRNKKGGEKYLSIWWFFVLVVIAGGIVMVISAYNVSDISTKKLESYILVTRFVDCVVDSGYLNEKFLAGNFDIFKSCYLSREIIEDGKHYFAYEVYKLNDCKYEKGMLKCKEPLISNSFGVTDFKNQCKIKEKMKEAKHYPECSEKKIYVLSKEKEKLMMYVVAGSNQKIKKEVL